MRCKCGRPLSTKSDLHCDKCLEIINKYVKKNARIKLNKRVFTEELGKFLDVPIKDLNIGDKNV